MLFHSLWLNLKIGVAGILTTWCLTLVPGMIWAMAWYTGWHISFTKMYEASETGASLGFLGLVLFAVVMVYVPTAQARHAFTQDWRSFFDWRQVWALVCHRPLQLCLLAGGYVIASGILLVFKGIPAFLPILNPALETLSSQASLDWINGYYWQTSALAFLVFVLLRTAAGYIYAGSLLDLWSQAVLSSDAFHPQEVGILRLFEVTYASCQPKPTLLSHVRQALTKVYRVGVIGITCLVWGICGFTPFVSEFIHFYPVQGFLNQPFVQLPCFRYVPPQLDLAGSIGSTRDG
jgi:hypothetical protein